MQHPVPSASAPQRAQRSLLNTVRENIQQLFTGQSIIGRERSSSAGAKTPRITLWVGDSPSTRLHIPYITRTPSNPSVSLHRLVDSSYVHPSPNQFPANAGTSRNTSRNIRHGMSTPHPVIPATNRAFVGVGPEEQYLADMAFRRSRRRHRRNQQRRRRRRGFFSVNGKKKIRGTALRCAVSGIVLFAVLSTYLALALSNKEESRSFHIVLILVILFAAICFSHALLRLCMKCRLQQQEHERLRDMAALVGPGGYANPPEPIPVTLARDEEAVGVQSETTKYPPPAYGLWRESVRVDPDRIFWQRNENVPSRHFARPSEGSITSTNRPPSYVSDDGVGYVVEAAPKSVAPSREVMPVSHSSPRRH